MFQTKLLEFDKLLNRISEYAKLDETKDSLFSLSPKRNRAEIINDLNETFEALNVIYRIGEFDIYHYTLKDSINRIRIEAVLNISEIVEIMKLIMNSNKTISYFKTDSVLLKIDYLKKHIDKLDSLNECKDLIYRVIDQEGDVLDTASDELYKIRRTLSKLDSELNTLFQRILRDYAMELSEQIVTVRGGHRVLPVRVEYKNRIKGIVYDESASGQTVYIEPYSVIEIGNKINEARRLEKEEINKIISKLSKDISIYFELIKSTDEGLRELDFIFSKAMYAKETDSTMPIINASIDLIDARHPLIDKEKIVPNTISLKESRRTMIITGPNTGGKTVVLKTLGLLTLMAQSGILIPVKEGSKVRVFDSIYADIGDEQSIEQSLSTFSSHMSRIASILNECEPNSLILFDELGSGTDPKEGASLAISILDYIRSKGIFSITTTHYPELKLYAYNNKQIENASVEFDNDTLKPTYRLLIGVSGGSNAFLVSERLGLKKEIIEAAKGISLEFKDDESTLIKKLEEDSLELDKKRQETDALRKSLEKELEENRKLIKSEKERLNKKHEKLDEKKEDILIKAQDEANLLLDEIRELKRRIESGEKVKENVFADLRGQANLLYKNKEIKRNYSNKEIKVGDHVNILSYGKTGVVTEIKGKYYTVALGSLTQRLLKEDIEYTEVVDLVSEIKQSKTERQVNLKTNVKAVLDMRGDRFEEAKEKLEKFIDDAVMANLNEVQIIHGFGSLVLRNMVIKYCNESNLIKGYRAGEEHEGGRGMTVVYLK